jgi:hypothetical protein
MGAFCVYGISKTLCKAQADKKTREGHWKELNRHPTIAEWAAKRDATAAQLFAELDKRVKISPEFDAPQFARDWIKTNPSEVKLALVMARAEKTDKNGERILRQGAPVMTWVEYVEPRASLF